MEPLIVTRVGVWADVEILQWMERNTLVNLHGDQSGEYVVRLNNHSQSNKRIAELLK